MQTYQNNTKEIGEVRPNIALWGVGTTENHGNTLPLGADLLLLELLLERVAQSLTESTYIIPTMPFGTSYRRFGEMGTINLHYSTLNDVVRDVVESIYDQNICEVVVINTHGSIEGSGVS